MSLKKLLVILLAVLVVALAFNACCRSADAGDRIFNLTVELQTCTPIDCQISQNYSTAFCVGRIGDEWILVTAGHSFYDYENRPGIIKSVVRSAKIGFDGKWSSVRVIAHSQPKGPRDIAWLGFKSDKELGVYCIAESTPATGTAASIRGYAGGDAYNVTNGTVKSRNDGRWKMTFHPAVVRGYSGSPVIVGNEAVGLVSTSDFSGETCCLSAEQIRESAMIALKQIPHCGQPKRGPPPAEELPKNGAANRERDCARPEIAPPPPSAPEMEEPPVPVPDPISTPPAGPQGPPGPPGAPGVKGERGDKGEPGKDADVSFLTIEINKLRAKIAELEAKKMPPIPVELYDADSGELIGRRVYEQGQPIKLATKRKVIK